MSDYRPHREGRFSGLWGEFWQLQFAVSLLRWVEGHVRQPTSHNLNQNNPSIVTNLKLNSNQTVSWHRVYRAATKLRSFNSSTLVFNYKITDSLVSKNCWQHLLITILIERFLECYPRSKCERPWWFTSAASSPWGRQVKIRTAVKVVSFRKRTIGRRCSRWVTVGILQKLGNLWVNRSEGLDKN